MLDSRPFAQFAPSERGLLALTSCNEQRFIGMDTHTASFDTGRALLFQGTLSAGFSGKVDDSTGDKGHLLFSRTTNGLPLPI